MDLIDPLFRAVGLFYVFAGYTSLRAILMDAFLDRAISALGAGREDPLEGTRRRLLGALGVSVGAGGAALALMSSWALPLFLLNTAAQALWLAGARRRFIAPQEDEESGRRQVANAALLYAVATAAVAWLWWTGRLGPWGDLAAIGGIILATAGLSFWFVVKLSWNPRPTTGDVDDAGEPYADETEPRRVLIDPAFGYWPLVDADNNRRFSHWRWLPAELAGQIEEWDDVFQLSFDGEDPLAPNVFPSPEAEEGYRTEADAIAVALRAVYGPGNVGFGPGWTDDDLPSPSPA